MYLEPNVSSLTQVFDSGYFARVIRPKGSVGSCEEVVISPLDRVIDAKNFHYRLDFLGDWEGIPFRTSCFLVIFREPTRYGTTLIAPAIDRLVRAYSEFGLSYLFPRLYDYWDNALLWEYLEPPWLNLKEAQYQIEREIEFGFAAVGQRLLFYRKRLEEECELAFYLLLKDNYLGFEDKYCELGKQFLDKCGRELMEHAVHYVRNFNSCRVVEEINPMMERLTKRSKSLNQLLIAAAKTVSEFHQAGKKVGVDLDKSGISLFTATGDYFVNREVRLLLRGLPDRKPPNFFLRLLKIVNPALVWRLVKRSDQSFVARLVSQSPRFRELYEQEKQHQEARYVALNGEGTIVLGDCKAENLMVRETIDGWEIKILDLEGLMLARSSVDLSGLAKSTFLSDNAELRTERIVKFKQACDKTIREIAGDWLIPQD